MIELQHAASLKMRMPREPEHHCDLIDFRQANVAIALGSW